MLARESKKIWGREGKTGIVLYLCQSEVAESANDTAALRYMDRSVVRCFVFWPIGTTTSKIVCQGQCGDRRHGRTIGARPVVCARARSCLLRTRGGVCVAGVAWMSLCSSAYKGCGRPQLADGHVRASALFLCMLQEAAPWVPVWWRMMV